MVHGQKMKKNKSEFEDLVSRIVRIIAVVKDAVIEHGVASAGHFKEVCLEFQGCVV